MVKKRAARKSNRVPVGGNRQKLTIPSHIEEYLKNEGLVPRWVNDTPGNISEHLQAGYFPVEDRGGEVAVGEENVDHARSSDSTIRKAVGATKAYANTEAILMAIPKDYYDEDQQEKQAELDELEKSQFTPNRDMGQEVREYERRRGRL